MRCKIEDMGCLGVLRSPLPNTSGMYSDVKNRLINRGIPDAQKILPDPGVGDWKGGKSIPNYIYLAMSITSCICGKHHLKHGGDYATYATILFLFFAFNVFVIGLGIP